MTSSPDSPDRLLRRHEAAARLGFAEKTLRKWASEGRGPVYLKMGRSVRYRPEDLRAWQDQFTTRAA